MIDKVHSLKGFSKNFQFKYFQQSFCLETIDNTSLSSLKLIMDSFNKKCGLIALITILFVSLESNLSDASDCSQACRDSAGECNSPALFTDCMNCCSNEGCQAVDASGMVRMHIAYYN